MLVLLMVIISLILPWFWLFTIPYFLYLMLTKRQRREKYLTEAIIWQTGGIMGTGDIDINKSIKLYNKACNMGCCYSCYQLARFYEYGSNGVEENENLYYKYIDKAEEIDEEEFWRLRNEDVRL